MAFKKKRIRFVSNNGTKKNRFLEVPIYNNEDSGLLPESAMGK